jgi:hypothetical protein
VAPLLSQAMGGVVRAGLARVRGGGVCAGGGGAGSRGDEVGLVGWVAGAEAAEHAGVLEADGAGGGLDGGAVADEVLGSF